MNGPAFLSESTNSSAWTDYETVLFDVLEALKPHFPQIAGGFARMTGGVDGEYIVSELRSVLATAPFQKRVQPWLFACFGELIAGDREERNHRFLEEALELVQSCGCTAHEAHQLVEYVYGRPAGQPSQEVGGVMVTLAALCLANDLDMHTAGEAELTRIWTKVDAIRAKQAAKPKHSPLPIASAMEGRALADVAAERARQVAKLGWTHEHDDSHGDDRALSRAAACFALADPHSGDSGPFWITHLRSPLQVWPYRWEWKPKDRRTNLVRAAALLIAEIERFDRAALIEGTEGDK